MKKDKKYKKKMCEREKISLYQKLIAIEEKRYEELKDLLAGGVEDEK